MGKVIYPLIVNLIVERTINNNDYCAFIIFRMTFNMTNLEPFGILQSDHIVKMLPFSSTCATMGN